MQFLALGNQGPYPSARYACSGYVVKTNQTLLLFDCGASTLQNLFQCCNPCELNAIFISHWHADHCSDLFALAYYYQFHLPQAKKIKLYTIHSNEPLYLAALNLPCFDIISVAEQDSIPFEDVEVRVFNAFHTIPSLMFAILSNGKKIVYTGDTNYFNGIESIVHSADAFICDSCFLHAMWGENKPHLSAKLAGEIARKASVKQLYLTHLNNMVHQDLIFQEAFQEFKSCQIIEPKKLYTL